MDDAVVAVAERLAVEFASLSIPAVIRVVTDCAGDFPNDDAQFVEQAARSRLPAIASRIESDVPHG